MHVMGSNKRTTGNGVALLQRFNSPSIAVQEDKDSSGILLVPEKEGEFLSTTEDMQEQVLAFAVEETGNSFASFNEKIAACGLGCASSGCDGKDEDFSQEGLNVGEGALKCDVDFVSNVKVELDKAVYNGDGEEEMYFLKHGMCHSGIQESRLFNENTLGRCGSTEEKPIVEVQVANEDLVSENVLEVKKKRLLLKLEAALLPKQEFADKKIISGKMVQDMPIGRSLGIEVIDETALIETIAALGMSNKTDVLGSRKCTGKDAVKDGKRSRKRAKGVKKILGMDLRHKNVTGMDKAQNGCSPENENGTKRKYPRKEIEALRFVKVVEQRKFWKAIYCGLDTAVAKEYDTLASSEHHIRLNYDPRECFAKKKETLLLSVGAANGRCRYVNVFVH